MTIVGPVQVVATARVMQSALDLQLTGAFRVVATALWSACGPRDGSDGRYLVRVRLGDDRPGTRAVIAAVTTDPPNSSGPVTPNGVTDSSFVVTAREVAGRVNLLDVGSGVKGAVIAGFTLVDDGTDCAVWVSTVLPDVAAFRVSNGSWAGRTELSGSETAIWSQLA